MRAVLLLCCLGWGMLVDAGVSSASPSPSRCSAAPTLTEVWRAARQVWMRDVPNPARRPRLRALLPSVAVRARWGSDWREAEQAVDVDRDQAIEVRAVWDLGDLLWSRDGAAVAQIELARARELREVRREVTEIYARWTRGHDPEARATLDAITDGWFGGAIARAKKVSPCPDPGEH